LARIPIIRDINLSQEKIVAKLGILGEPITLASILGAGLGALAWLAGRTMLCAGRKDGNSYAAFA